MEDTKREECHYCTLDEEGKLGPHWEELIFNLDIPITRGVKRDDALAYFSLMTNLSVYVDAGIDGGILGIGLDDEGAGEPFIKEQINYCPMCGRRLREKLVKVAKPIMVFQSHEKEQQEIINLAKAQCKADSGQQNCKIAPVQKENK